MAILTNKTGHRVWNRLLFASACAAIAACIVLQYVRKDKFPYVGQWVCQTKYAYGPGYNTITLAVTSERRCFITFRWPVGVIQKAECNYRMRSHQVIIRYPYQAGEFVRDRNGRVSLQPWKGIVTERVTLQDSGRVLIGEPLQWDYQIVGGESAGKRGTFVFKPMKNTFRKISDKA